MKLKTLLNVMDIKQEVILATPKKMKVTVYAILQDKELLERKVINVLIIENEFTIFIK